MKSVCVFLGSHFGNEDDFLSLAQKLGKLLAEQGIQLVYGGTKIGLMGAIADSVLTHGGTVVGVLPRLLKDRDLAHENLSNLIICESMHEKKAKMFELSDSFIALPGSFGTLEEIMEVITWKQLRLHKFPIGILNVGGYYDHLDKLFTNMEVKSFLKSENRKIVIFDRSPEGLLGKMRESECL